MIDTQQLLLDSESNHKKSATSNVHFSSATDQWATPSDTFDKLNKIFNFETDVCADSANAKCKNFYTEEMDGLKQDWQGVCWMNPPLRKTNRGLVKKSIY